MNLGRVLDLTKLERGAHSQQVLHTLHCPCRAPRGLRSPFVQDAQQPAAASRRRLQQRRWPQVHCCAAEQTPPESGASADAASAADADSDSEEESDSEAEDEVDAKSRSFWDELLRPEPVKPLLPEQSKLIGREIYLLVLQQRLDQQVQRALNMDNFELAKALREERQSVDADLEDLQTKKGRGCGAGFHRGSEGADLASRGIRLRSEMQQAIEQEQYQDAARIRDELKEMQASIDAQQAEEESWRRDLPDERCYRLGQRVTHHRGFQGSIVGWDLCCCEDSEWQAGVQDCQAARGAKQPFYHLLLDIATLGGLDRQRLKAAGLTNYTAYVPEDSLSAPSEDSSWLEEEGDGPLMHPWADQLFYGKDARGDLVPTQRLRDRFSQERRDVYDKNEPEEDHGQDDDDASPNLPPGFPGGPGPGWDLPDSNFPTGGTTFTP